MARIDLARRAQIGRDRRAKTRQQLVDAARGLYSENAIEAVTVDNVVDAAAVAKGTFYIHFNSLTELQSAVADELAQEFDELLQPRRLMIADPIERIAAGCCAFVEQAIRHPAWSALVARGAASIPNFARTARERVVEDIANAAAAGQLGAVMPELAAEFVFGIVLQAMQAAGAARLAPNQTGPVVAGVLRAIGVAPEQAQEISNRALSSIEGERAIAPLQNA